MLGSHDGTRDRTAELAELRRGVHEIKRMMKDANGTWSRKHSETITRMDAIDRQLVAAKTELMLMRGYRQDGDPV